ncbi:hypothetical protein ACWD6L_24010 [Micromonospora profundi]|uniref:Uncharacterized protein n=1 Tax=Micromonospora profundi TaxID=1420889 RepID=A0AAJ6HTF8_9ACTN|nr:MULTISPECIES: hypothetical protein [Micromonospora]KOX08935.1 hypothetical protein ADK66_14325 [Micromonospora sp. NRRL B-16802]NJC14347.1 hypothetical protein [Micromonospora profundi]WLS45902.1 hypothetical protein Q3V37_01015 [Micromonospora profundi]
MTSQQLTTDLAGTDHVEDQHPAGEPRVSPVVAFGLRTAALAGLAVPVGLLVGHLVSGDVGAAQDSAITLPLTTCCPTVAL